METTETTAEAIDPKVQALAKFLECDVSEIDETSDDARFDYGRRQYLVLTDEEADECCGEEIRNSLWAFNTSFLRAHVSRENQRALEALDKVRGDLCEDANALVFALIKDVDHLIDDAIGADGRSHFLNTYDGDENEETIDGVTFYIYRQN